MAGGKGLSRTLDNLIRACESAAAYARGAAAAEAAAVSMKSGLLGPQFIAPGHRSRRAAVGLRWYRDVSVRSLYRTSCCLCCCAVPTPCKPSLPERKLHACAYVQTDHTHSVTTLARAGWHSGREGLDPGALKVNT
jgi:hypothetical protein